MKPAPPILDHPPAFRQPLHVGRPNLGDREVFLRRVNEIFERRWLTNSGPLVQEFEQRIATYVGVKHCMCVCNATIALEIVTRAAGLKGEVIVPSYTFIATAHALQWQEITPIFADMDPSTYNIDPSRIERHITPRTTGILATHVWGRACDISALADIARRRNLILIFDAAHAFACSHQGKVIGGSGLAEVFSFHATKFLNSFEGGAITTNDDDLAKRIRLMINFGFSGYDSVIYPGTNGKMTEVCAAMGLTSLESMEDIIATNRRNYGCYREGLSALPGLRLIQYDPRERNNYQYVVVEIDPNEAPLTRDELVTVLHAENVLARKYFWPGCHRMEPYRSFQPNALLLLPETERVAARIMVLPTGQEVGPMEVARISAIIADAFQQAENLRPLLHQQPAVGVS
jgi:dTDP-4-amino-4,6-dideoxygalactose transaminase